MAVDAMFKLEHGVQDQQKSKKALPTLAQLKVKWSDSSEQRKVELMIKLQLCKLEYEKEFKYFTLQMAHPLYTLFSTLFSTNFLRCCQGLL